MPAIANPYRDTKLGALLHSYLVLKLCTYSNYLPLKTIAKHHELLRPVLKHTLFKQFAGAEDLVELASLKKELQSRGVKCILDLAIEADLDTVSTDATFDEVVSRLLETVRNSQNSFVAIKATALGQPKALEHVSAACAYALHQFDIITNYQALSKTHILSKEHIKKWLMTLPGHKFITASDQEKIFEALSNKNAPANPLMVVNPLVQKNWFIGHHPSTPTSVGRDLTLADINDFQMICKRFNELIAEAKKYDAKLMLDAEQSYFQSAIDLLHLCSTIHSKPIVYNTYQMYLKSSLSRMARDIASRPMGVKLVRGAYMQQERKYAKEHRILDPVHDSASATHAAYDGAAKFLHNQKTPLVLATHNWNSIEAAMNNPQAGFAQLYGMGDWMTIELARRGIACYKYVPFGSVQETVPYLLRRAQENSSALGGVGKDLEYLRDAIKSRMFGKDSKDKPVNYEPE